MRRRGQRRVLPGLYRWMRRLVAAAWTLLLLGFSGIASALWLSLPPEGEFRLPGMDAAVSVTLDGDGIPLIRAGSERDAAAALGFVHARDRMFQMDLMRRNASGRLSEVAGPATLRLDRTMRVLGLRRRDAEHEESQRELQ